MTRNRILLISLFSASLILIASCREKSSEALHRTVFISKDSLTEYSLEIYTRIVKNNAVRQEFLNVPVEIIITSPSGTTYTDVQNLFFDKAENKQVGRWIDFMWRYREGVRFPENGEWQFSISSRSGAGLLKDIGIVIK